MDEENKRQQREDNTKSKLDELKRQQAAAKAAAVAAKTKPSIKPMTAPVGRKSKEDKPKVVLSSQKKRKCYMWYARLGQPNRERMIQAVKRLPPSHEQITEEDVESLPWICGGALLPVKEMNELFLEDVKIWMEL